MSNDCKSCGRLAYQVQSLEDKLTRQSTKLAEALKLKNDALEHEAVVIKDVNIQLDHVRCALPVFVQGSTVLERVKNFVEVYKQVNKQAIVSGEANLKLIKEILEKGEELKKLRLPEPKFRVGQVVMAEYLDGSGIYPFKIVSFKLWGDKSVGYTNQHESTVPENRVRALEESEK